MLSFTKLETALLQEAASRPDELGTALRRQLAAAQIVKRDVTGAGFYVHVEINRSTAPSAPWRGMHASGYGRVVGVDVGSVEITGIIWFDEHGYMTCLEAYQLGGADGEPPVDLRRFDLAALDLAP